MNRGYIGLFRKIQDHWIFENDKYFKMWMTILLNVNHSEMKFPVNGELFTCKPGESFRSIDAWCMLLKCQKKALYKFFNLLEKNAMLERKIYGKGNQRKHLLTVVNWNKYQKKDTEKDTETTPEKDTEKTPITIIKEKDINGKKIYTPDFLNFFERYDWDIKKDLTFKEWEKLSEDEIKELFRCLPVYLEKTKPDYKSEPANFIKNGKWKKYKNSLTDSDCDENYTREVERF